MSLPFSAQLLVRLLLFPGILFAVPAGWLCIWGEQAAVARMQRRIGPPLLAPFFDLIKLLGKRVPARHGLEAGLLRLYPVCSVFSLAAALALLPVFPETAHGFPMDGLLLVALLELPSVLFLLAGFTSGSVYAETSALREAILTLLNDSVFLLAFITLAITARSLHIAAMAAPARNPGHWIAVLAILFCLPVRLRLNPFSTAAGERETHAGPLSDYAGTALGLWETACALEWVALTGLVAVLVLPAGGAWWIHALLFLALILTQVLLLAALAAGTARFTLEQSIGFYARWVAALLAIASFAGIWLRVRL